MTRTSPPQRAFSSGEISPLLYARPDYRRYQTGLRACRGFLPLVEGGATRAPGTIYRGRTRGDAVARLIAFEFAENDAVILEFTANVMRVWRYGQPVLDGASPYELATPFGAGSLDKLQWVQSADVIYLADGTQPIQKLSRLALDNWTIAAAALDFGPFRVPNDNAALTIQASAETGTVTLTASASVFVADHVGSLLQLEALDNDGIPQWAPDVTATTGDLFRYDGNIYQLTAGTNTGVNAPIHLEGADKTDPQAGSVFTFLSGPKGIVRITAVASGTSATATVIKRLPKPVTTDPTPNWAEGAWSERYGYPAALEIFQQRLVAAATPSEPRTIWFSTVGDYENFEPGTDADESFAYAVAGSRSLNRIHWLAAGKKGLHIGALGEEHSTRSDTAAQVIGPTTTVIGLDATIGSRPIKPIVPDGKPIFVSKDGAQVYELRFAFDEDAHLPINLSRASAHLGASGFAEIVWQSSPQRMAWLRLGSGELAALLHDPLEEVLGWAPYPLAGGKALSLAVSPNAAGSKDVVTMVVERVIDGETVRTIEDMADTYGILSGAEPVHSAVHLFCAKTFSAESETADFTVAHLAGADVYAWTEKGNYGPVTVSAGGTLTLAETVKNAVIGLVDATQRLELLDPVAQAPDGDTTGRRKRYAGRVGVVVHRSAACTVQTVEREPPQPERLNGAQDIFDRVALDPSVGFSGTIALAGVSGSAPEIGLRFAPRGGAPLTILATVPMVSEDGG